MRILVASLVALSGVLASIGVLRLGVFFLAGALGASIATAAKRPRQISSWIAPAVLVATIVVVLLADFVGVGTHHAGA